MSIEVSSMVPEHTLPSEEIDPVESEVRAVVRLLVQCVATEHVVAEQQTLLAELEDYQAQCWTRDELRHRQRMRARAAALAQQQTARAASSCRLQHQPAAAKRASSCSATRAPASDGGEPPQGTLRPRRRAKLRTLSAQVDADFSALATRMQALSVGAQNGAVAPAPARGAVGGGSGAGIASRSGSGLSATSASARRSTDEGRRRRGLEGGERTLGAETCGAADLDFADLSFVETLLPSVPCIHALHSPVHSEHPHTRAIPSSAPRRHAERQPRALQAPARSQFVFEVEQPVVSHAQSNESVHDRLLQRRLTLLAGLQAAALGQMWSIDLAPVFGPSHRPGSSPARPLTPF